MKPEFKPRMSIFTKHGVFLEEDVKKSVRKTKKKLRAQAYADGSAYNLDVRRFLGYVSYLEKQKRLLKTRMTNLKKQLGKLAR